MHKHSKENLSTLRIVLEYLHTALYNTQVNALKSKLVHIGHTHYTFPTYLQHLLFRHFFLSI